MARVVNQTNMSLAHWVRRSMGLALAWLVVIAAAGCGEAAVKDGDVFDASKANDEEVLVFAVKDGDTGTVKKFLDAVPEALNTLDSSGNTLLHHAAVFSQLDMAKLLVDRGANVNARNTDGMTPLGAAMDRRASDEVIEYLESKGGQE